MSREEAQRLHDEDPNQTHAPTEAIPIREPIWDTNVAADSAVINHHWKCLLLGLMREVPKQKCLNEDSGVTTKDQ